MFRVETVLNKENENCHLARTFRLTGTKWQVFVWESRQHGRRGAESVFWSSALRLRLSVDLCEVSPSPLILAAYVEYFLSILGTFKSATRWGAKAVGSIPCQGPYKNQPGRQRGVEQINVSLSLSNQ